MIYKLLVGTSNGRIFASQDIHHFFKRSALITHVVQRATKTMNFQYNHLQHAKAILLFYYLFYFLKNYFSFNNKQKNISNKYIKHIEAIQKNVV